MKELQRGDITNEMIPIERIRNAIYLVGGQKVILDRDLSALWRVHQGAQTGCQAKCRSVSCSLYVYPHARGAYELEATICDLQRKMLRD